MLLRERGGLIVDFLECMIDLADEPLESRLVQHLLSSPIGDGGQFDMVIVICPLSLSSDFIEEPRSKIRTCSSNCLSRRILCNSVISSQLAHHRQTPRKRPHPPRLGLLILRRRQNPHRESQNDGRNLRSNGHCVRPSSKTRRIFRLDIYRQRGQIPSRQIHANTILQRLRFQGRRTFQSNQ